LNFDTEIETFIRDSAEAISADYTPMYSSPNPAELYELVTSRLTAGVPCVYSRVVSMPSISRDTGNSIYDTTINIEIILAVSVVGQYDRNNVSPIRELKKDFLNNIRTRTITIGTDPRPHRLNFTNLGIHLFRDNQIEAESLNCNIFTVVDFNEIFT
jgi:hypothetical protein